MSPDAPTHTFIVHTPILTLKYEEECQNMVVAIATTIAYRMNLSTVGFESSYRQSDASDPDRITFAHIQLKLTEEISDDQIYDIQFYTNGLRKLLCNVEVP